MFARDVRTKYRMGGISNRYFLIAYGGWKFKVLARAVYPMWSLLGLQVATFLLCLDMDLCPGIYTRLVSVPLIKLVIPD